MTVVGRLGEPTPVSPCVGICLLDPATGHCRGCVRSVAEIAGWYQASAAEKRAILPRLSERRRLPEGDLHDRS
jgi:predicted Fe-S protein YdhL (DUF1289 family)